MQIDVESAQAALRLQSGRQIEDTFEGEEDLEKRKGDPGYKVWGWNDIKRLKWQEHLGHCSKETLFGTPGDEFDQLAFSQEVMLRKELADIIHVELNKPWCARHINNFVDKGRENYTDPWSKLRSNEREGYTQLVVALLEHEKMTPAERKATDKAKDKILSDAMKAANKIVKKGGKPKDLDYDPGEEVEEANESEEEFDENEYLEEDCLEDNYEPTVKQKKKRKGQKGYNLDGTKRSGYLHLGNALKDVKNKRNWSNARVKAYIQEKGKPNAFYYRFNKHGEEIALGHWSKHEAKCFFESLLLRGANHKWGNFSKSIPGRVGYTASQFWRTLQKRGWVWDMNYYDNKHFKNECLDVKQKGREPLNRYDFVLLNDPTGTFKKFPAIHGNADPEFVKRFENHPLILKYARKKKGDSIKKMYEDTPTDFVKMPRSEYFRVKIWPEKLKKEKGKESGEKRKQDTLDTPPPKRVKAEKATKKKAKARTKTKRSRKRKREYSVSDEEDDENFTLWKPIKQKKKGPVLPDFSDPITGLEMERPSISPYGHVMEHETWTKLLYKKKVCPITGQKLSRRDLIRLNGRNIAEYIPKIKALTQSQVVSMGNAMMLLNQQEEEEDEKKA